MKELLDKYGKDIVESLRISMQEKGLNATGKTSKAIRYVAKDLTLTVYAPKGMGALENGRRPTRSGGTGKLVENLMEWVKARNIPEAAVWAIAKKIHKEGWNVPNQYNPGRVISDVINPELVQKLKKDIGRELKKVLLFGK